MYQYISTLFNLFIGYFVNQVKSIGGTRPYANVTKGLTAADVAEIVLHWQDKSARLIHPNVANLIAAGTVNRIVKHSSFRPNLPARNTYGVRDIQSYEALRWLTEFQIAYEEELEKEVVDDIIRMRRCLAIDAGVCMDCHTLLLDVGFECDACHNVERAMMVAKVNADHIDE